jgi:hypothetical protein
VNADRSSLLAALIVIGVSAFAIGAASLQQAYQHGSPRCAEACMGTSSIFHGGACYCGQPDGKKTGSAR